MSQEGFLLFSIILVIFFFFFSFGTIASPVPDSGFNFTHDDLTQKNGTGNTNSADNNNTDVPGVSCAKASQNGFKIEECSGTFTELFIKVVMTTKSEIVASSGKCQVRVSTSNHEKIDISVDTLKAVLDIDSDQYKALLKDCGEKGGMINLPKGNKDEADLKIEFSFKDEKD